MAGRDRSPTAAAERHGLQNEGFGERPLRRTLGDSNGSVCDRRLLGFIAGKAPLDIRVP